MYTKLPIELKPNNAKKPINSSRKTTIRFFTIDQREWLYNTTFHKDKYLLQEFFFSYYQIVMKYKQFRNVSMIN